MRTLLCALLIMTTMSGCAIYTPSGAIVVDPAGPGPSSGGGGFCPPGQAKKGNC